jgi:chorismate mutase/prephenate dehydratase
MFKVPHHPGSLVDALGVFKQNKLNLTWIESFPAKSPRSEYVFFVDFEGHQADPAVQNVLAALRDRCLFLKVLGSYPAAA